MRSRGKLGLAGRAGRWSAAHRKTAIWGWILFVVAAIAIGGALGTKTLSDSQTGVGESAAAGKTLEGGFPHGADESVLVQIARRRIGAWGAGQGSGRRGRSAAPQAALRRRTERPL